MSCTAPTNLAGNIAGSVVVTRSSSPGVGNPIRKQTIRIIEINRIIANVSIPVNPVRIAQRVALGKPGLVRIVISRPVVSQPTGIRFSAGIAVKRNGSGAADFAAVSVEALGGGDRFCCVGGRQHGADAILMVVSRRGAGQVDVAGQPCQWMVGAGLNVDCVGRGPAAAGVFGVD